MNELNEYRVGNLVENSRGLFKYTRIEWTEGESRLIESAGLLPLFSDYNYLVEIYTGPIELTSGYLKDFGFEKTSDGRYYQLDGVMVKQLSYSNAWYLGFEKDGNLKRKANISKIHQLQNVYEDLVGKLLELKKGQQ